MVLYDDANNLYGRYSNIETGGGGGKGGLHANICKCIKKYRIDLSVPNFNVTDCRLNQSYSNPFASFCFDFIE